MYEGAGMSTSEADGYDMRPASIRNPPCREGAVRQHAGSELRSQRDIDNRINAL